MFPYGPKYSPTKFKKFLSPQKAQQQVVDLVTPSTSSSKAQTPSTGTQSGSEGIKVGPFSHGLSPKPCLDMSDGEDEDGVWCFASDQASTQAKSV